MGPDTSAFVANGRRDCRRREPKRDERKLLDAKMSREITEFGLQGMRRKILDQRDGVHLVDGDDKTADAEGCDDQRMTRGLRRQSIGALTSRSARSAVDAPVAMFRVYCSCPGTSATMNLRRRCCEEPVGNIDRDFLLALGRKTVEKQRKVEFVALRAVSRGFALEFCELVGQQVSGFVEQPADQRRLAVVNRAAHDEAQKVLALAAGATKSSAIAIARERPARSSEISFLLLALHGGGCHRDRSGGRAVRNIGSPPSPG